MILHIYGELWGILQEWDEIFDLPELVAIITNTNWSAYLFVLTLTLPHRQQPLNYILLSQNYRQSTNIKAGVYAVSLWSMLSLHTCYDTSWFWIERAPMAPNFPLCCRRLFLSREWRRPPSSAQHICHCRHLRWVVAPFCLITMCYLLGMYNNSRPASRTSHAPHRIPFL